MTKLLFMLSTFSLFSGICMQQAYAKNITEWARDLFTSKEITKSDIKENESENPKVIKVPDDEVSE